MADVELKACPFCGARTTENGGPQPWESDGEHHIYCWACSAQGPNKNMAYKAIAAWNTRSSPTPELRELYDTLKEVTFYAETSGGTAGPDAVLQDAIARAGRVLRAYEATNA